MTKTAVSLFALLFLAASGCASAPPSPAVVAELSRLPYPADAARGDDLDIVARQERGKLVLLNRMPRSYENVQLWINQQYVARPRRIGVGPTPTRVALTRFIDRHRRPYPQPGLLTPDAGFPAVLVELYDPATGRKHPLLSRDPLAPGSVVPRGAGGR